MSAGSIPRIATQHDLEIHLKKIDIHMASSVVLTEASASNNHGEVVLEIITNATNRVAFDKTDIPLDTVFRLIKEARLAIHDVTGTTGSGTVMEFLRSTD